jgi:hypothetical protein
VAQVVERLHSKPSKHESLILNPSTTKKKKKEKEVLKKTQYHFIDVPYLFQKKFQVS